MTAVHSGSAKAALSGPALAEATSEAAREGGLWTQEMAVKLGPVEEEPLEQAAGPQ